MFWPIFGSTGLRVADCGAVHPRCCLPVAWGLPHGSGMCHAGLLAACEQEHLLQLTGCQQACVACANVVWGLPAGGIVGALCHGL